MGLTVGSLFSGIGGLDLGLERAGLTVKWQVEIDDYASKVLAKHWPDVARFRDVRECGAGNLAPVDLIAGGFPCVDLSNAGRQAGISGKHSGLWSEFARIVRELRPRYVLVENVPIITKRGLDVVLGDLAGCGYDAEWQCLSASGFGAWHQRTRLFILAYLAGSGRPQRKRKRRHAADAGQSPDRLFAGSVENVVGAWRVIECPCCGEDWCNWHGEHCERCGCPPWDLDQPDAGWWAAEPDVVRVAYGVPARMDRLRGLGNAVVPQVAEYIGRCIMAAEEAA